MFKYYLKKILHNKDFVFWTLMFPICIMICFKFAFGNLYDMENHIEPVKAVYINTYDIDFKAIMPRLLEDFGLNGIAEEFQVKELLEAIENNDKSFIDNYRFDKDDVESYIKAHEDEFSGISDKFENLDIEEYLNDLGIDNLNEAAYGLMFGMALDSSGTDEENKCFDLVDASRVENMTIEEAEKMLDEDEVHVVFIYENGKLRTLLSSNYSQMDLMITETFLSTFDSMYSMVSDSLIDENGDLTLFSNFTGRENLQNDIASKTYLKVKDSVFEEEPNPYNWYYYSTFVMGIMFQILSGIGIVADIQADLSKGALRVGLSSTSKMKIYISVFLSRLVLVLACEGIHLLAIKYVFGIPIGNRVPQMILFLLVANIFALSLGELFGLFLKGDISKRENTANGLLMTSVFLSGEMMASLPGMFELNCPIINRINPATILNFAFYKLVYYEELSGFYMNILTIAIAAAVFITISILKIRRQKYASL